MDNITITLAEDHALTREGTHHILEQYPEFKIVGEAEDGEKALQLINQLKPDVAILDVRMPKLNGIEVVRQMKQCCPKTKALMLTAYDDDDYVFALMEAGAAGYLLKTSSGKAVADSVRAVNSGEAVMDPAIAMKIARSCAQGGTLNKSGTEEQLSPRELEMIEQAGLLQKSPNPASMGSLGTLEAQVMQYMWEVKVAPVNQVVQVLSNRRPVAYTTVMTVMGHLVDKKLLTRTIDGNRYIYRIAQTREDFLRTTSRNMIREILRNWGDMAITEFIQEIGKIKPEKLEEIKDLIP